MAKLTLELNEIVNGVTINESPIQLTSEGLLASAATIASDVTFTPTGGISATNVQAALAEVDSEKLSLSGGTMTGNIQFTDSQRIQLGTGFDFQMYHDGSNSYLRDFGVGDLILQASNLQMIDSGGESYIQCTDDGSVSLYYDNAKKIETASSGAVVTGTLTSDTANIGSSTLVVTSGGDVAVGQLSASTKLDVAGTVTATGLDINGNADVSGNIVIGGNLEVQGTTTTVDSTTVNIADKNIELGYNATTDLQNDGAGITISRPESTDATITWDETNDRFAMTNGLYLQGDLQLNGFPESTYEVKGDMDGGIRFHAQADEDVAKGDVVYISGASGDNTLIRKARADSTSTMPAFGLCLTAATSGNQVQVVSFGNLYGSGTPALRLDTSAYDPGTTLYVSATEAGVWTNVKPAGESNLIQNIGKVVRSSTTNGVIKVGGAGRTNATPNLNDGNIFIGNASNQASTSSFNTLVGNVALLQTGGTLTGDLDITGDLTAAKASAPAGIFNRTTDVGDVVRLQYAGTDKGNVGVNSSNEVYVINASGGVRLSNTDIKPTLDGSNTNDDAMDLGGASNRFKNLYLSEGVALGGTAAQNKLDYYEEGTIDAKLADAASGGNEATVTTTQAYYTRIGQLVTCHIRFAAIDTTGMTAGNQLFITGLPFNNRGNSVAPATLYTVQVDSGSGSTGTFGLLAGGQDNLPLRIVYEGGGTAILPVSSINNNTAQITTSFSYITLDT